MLAALPVVRAPRRRQHCRSRPHHQRPAHDLPRDAARGSGCRRGGRQGPTGRPSDAPVPREPGILVLQWLGEDGPVAGWLREAAEALACPVFVYEDFQQPFLARRADGSLSESTSKRHRKDYERRARRMAEELGAELELVDRADDPRSVTEYLAMEAAGYKTDNGVAMLTQARRAGVLRRDVPGLRPRGASPRPRAPGGLEDRRHTGLATSGRHRVPDQGRSRRVLRSIRPGGPAPPAGGRVFPRPHGRRADCGSARSPTGTRCCSACTRTVAASPLW